MTDPAFLAFEIMRAPGSAIHLIYQPPFLV